jgi:formylglycine-generating enzyme required for sulfatase activity
VLTFLVLLAGCWAAADGFGKEPEAITNSIEMKLVLIPAGHFMMGARKSIAATRCAPIPTATQNGSMANCRTTR